MCSLTSENLSNRLIGTFRPISNNSVEVEGSHEIVTITRKRLSCTEIKVNPDSVVEFLADNTLNTVSSIVIHGCQDTGNFIQLDTTDLDSTESWSCDLQQYSITRFTKLLFIVGPRSLKCWATIIQPDTCETNVLSEHTKSCPAKTLESIHHVDKYNGKIQTDYLDGSSGCEPMGTVRPASVPTEVCEIASRSVISQESDVIHSVDRECVRHRLHSFLTEITSSKNSGTMSCGSSADQNRSCTSQSSDNGDDMDASEETVYRSHQTMLHASSTAFSNTHSPTQNVLNSVSQVAGILPKFWGLSSSSSSIDRKLFPGVQAKVSGASKHLSATKRHSEDETDSYEAMRLASRPFSSGQLFHLPTSMFSPSTTIFVRQDGTFEPSSVIVPIGAQVEWKFQNSNVFPRSKSINTQTRYTPLGAFSPANSCILYGVPPDSLSNSNSWLLTRVLSTARLTLSYSELAKSVISQELNKLFEWESPRIQLGESFRMEFKIPGTYYFKHFFCPTQRGRLIVAYPQDHGANAEANLEFDMHNVDPTQRDDALALVWHLAELVRSMVSKGSTALELPCESQQNSLSSGSMVENTTQSVSNSMGGVTDENNRSAWKSTGIIQLSHKSNFSEISESLEHRKTEKTDNLKTFSSSSSVPPPTVQSTGGLSATKAKEISQLLMLQKKKINDDIETKQEPQTDCESSFISDELQQNSTDSSKLAQNIAERKHARNIRKRARRKAAKEKRQTLHAEGTVNSFSTVSAQSSCAINNDITRTNTHLSGSRTRESKKSVNKQSSMQQTHPATEGRPRRLQARNPTHTDIGVHSSTPTSTSINSSMNVSCTTMSSTEGQNMSTLQIGNSRTESMPVASIKPLPQRHRKLRNSNKSHSNDQLSAQASEMSKANSGDKRKPKRNKGKKRQSISTQNTLDTGSSQNNLTTEHELAKTMDGKQVENPSSSLEQRQQNRSPRQPRVQSCKKTPPSTQKLSCKSTCERNLLTKLKTADTDSSMPSAIKQAKNDAMEPKDRTTSMPLPIQQSTAQLSKSMIQYKTTQLCCSLPENDITPNSSPIHGTTQSSCVTSSNVMIDGTHQSTHTTTKVQLTTNNFKAAHTSQSVSTTVEGSSRRAPSKSAIKTRQISEQVASCTGTMNSSHTHQSDPVIAIEKSNRRSCYDDIRINRDSSTPSQGSSTLNTNGICQTTLWSSSVCAFSVCMTTACSQTETSKALGAAITPVASLSSLMDEEEDMNTAQSIHTMHQQSQRTQVTQVCQQARAIATCCTRSTQYGYDSQSSFTHAFHSNANPNMEHKQSIRHAQSTQSRNQMTYNHLPRSNTPTKPPQPISRNQLPQSITSTRPPQPITRNQLPQSITPTKPPQPTRNQLPQSITPTKPPQPITPTKPPQPITRNQLPQSITPTKPPQPITRNQLPQSITPTKPPQPITHTQLPRPTAYSSPKSILQSMAHKVHSDQSEAFYRSRIASDQIRQLFAARMATVRHAYESQDSSSGAYLDDLSITVVRN